MQLEAHIYHRHYLALNEREWGLPTGMYVGKMWRSTINGVPWVHIVRPVSLGMVGVESARVVPDPATSFPPGWREWMADYVKNWPHSSLSIARWAALTGDERAKLAAQILSTRSDPIGESGRFATVRALLDVAPVLK